MLRKLMLFLLISSCYDVVGQGEFLKEMQSHKNIFDQGFSEISTEYKDSNFISSNDFDDLMTYGIERQKSGDHVLAISLFKKAKILHEEFYGGFSKSHRSISQINPYPDYLIGLSYYHLSMIDSATFHYKSAINEAPFFSEPYVELGNIFLQKEQLDSAMSYYEGGYKIAPNSEFLNHNLGLVYLKLEDLSTAQKYFLKNIGINPNFQPSYVLAATVYENKANYHMAEIFYSKAIILSETKADNLIARGYYYLRREEYGRAQRDFRSAHDMVPLNSDVIWQLALLELWSNNYEYGMDLISQMSRSRPAVNERLRFNTNEYRDAEIAALLDLYSVGNYTTSEKILLGQLLSEVFFNKKNGTYQSANELMKIDPDSELISRIWLYSKSSIYLRKGDVSFQLVNNYITKIDSVLVKFRSPEIHLLKGTVCYIYGAYDMALLQMEEVLKLDPNFTIAYWYMGNMYFEMEEFDKAIKSFSRAIDLAPYYFKARNARGNAYREKNLYRKAIDDYEQVLKSSEFHGWAYNDMGVCYQKIGMYDSALFYFNKAIKSNDQHVVTYTNRGDLFSEHNQYDRAIMDYSKALSLNVNYYQAREKRADLFFKNGEIKMAVNDYIKTLKFFQQEKFKFRDRGNAHLILKKYQRANKELMSVCSSDSIKSLKNRENQFVKEYSRNYTDVGLIKFNRKEIDQSKANFLIALEIDPNNAKAIGSIARIELHSKRYKESIQLYERFKKMASEKELNNAMYLLELTVPDEEVGFQAQYILDTVFKN